ncbi:MAG: hypothetical protein EKK55_21460 [Rhodocyclaceae bacterium]|nr:MAG: hypothetical protein EKK55_21460 [Rhodocyclaceae bacterium]
MPAVAVAVFAQLTAATLDDAIRAAFSDPADLAACERVMDAMRFKHGMKYNDCVARVAQVVPGADYEAIAQEIDSSGRGDDAR